MLKEVIDREIVIKNDGAEARLDVGPGPGARRGDRAGVGADSEQMGRRSPHAVLGNDGGEGGRGTAQDGGRWEGEQGHF